ncbi:MAG TPA: deoxyguanosinetriphosphate triphosphohydrolase [Armatimonadetes bacterium]|nr:deoxyguanosinetriphosphate triphosphohydrolase [Armatimonadota bacterium]
MCPREITERWEMEYLAPYAAKAALSRGRGRPEDKCPIRTDFQRDRDRIIHSKAFRRLMHKTQVFIAPRGDHYRTRMTHALEVAQIGRTICRALRLNEDLAEAIALGHDLGHPPFGHAGEQVLDRVYRKYDSNARFCHWEQSLRVVDILEKDGEGLNLTWEVRDGIVHHSKGMADLEADDESCADEPATLEGKVIRIADRIAYVNHDLDDALRAGILTIEDIPTSIRRTLGEHHAQRITTLVSDIVSNGVSDGEVCMSPHILRAFNDLKDFLYERVYLDERLVKAEVEKVERMIEALFDYYMRHPDAVPLFDVARSSSLSQVELARTVCDYIAGMTDRYAIDQFARIYVPQGWQVA